MHRELESETIYYGDCLEVLREMRSEQVDLIYLDPPFNSERNYNVVFTHDLNRNERSQFRAFTDTWHWGDKAAERVSQITDAVSHPAHDVVSGLYRILGESSDMSYLSYMAQRIAELKRVLKPTGTIYLHCDPTMSHYLKLVLDSIFGDNNCRNEIIWYYRGAGVPNLDFARRHDVIFRYAHENRYFNPDPARQPYATATVDRFEHHIGNVRGDQDFGEQELHPLGKWPDDVLTDIQPIAPSARERTGYPTQKPLALLDRIIKVSSKEGDFVLDPFCGCGTGMVSAHKLGRKWAGIDISSFACQSVMRERFKKAGFECRIEGVPSDLESARYMWEQNPFKFEEWAVGQIVGMAPNTKQVGDGGIDGRGKMAGQATEGNRLVLAQVKGGGVQIKHVREFMGVMARTGATAGIFVTMERSQVNKNMKQEAGNLGQYRLIDALTDEISKTEYPRMEFWSIEDHFDSRMRPNLPAMLDPMHGKKLAEQEGLFPGS